MSADISIFGKSKKNPQSPETSNTLSAPTRKKMSADNKVEWSLSIGKDVRLTLRLAPPKTNYCAPWEMLNHLKEIARKAFSTLKKSCRSMKSLQTKAGEDTSKTNIDFICGHIACLQKTLTTIEQNKGGKTKHLVSILLVRFWNFLAMWSRLSFGRSYAWSFTTRKFSPVQVFV